MPTAQQFDAYIDQLMNEIKLIGDHDALWKTVPGINNSPGNLGLHIAGNLQHFIGSILGKTGYVRHREEEFSQKGLQTEAVLAELMKAREIVATVLTGYSEQDFLQLYPEDFKGRKVSISEALSHLFAHMAYHTGQVNYFRRITNEN